MVKESVVVLQGVDERGGLFHRRLQPTFIAGDRPESREQGRFEVQTVQEHPGTRVGQQVPSDGVETLLAVGLSQRRTLPGDVDTGDRAARAKIGPEFHCGAVEVVIAGPSLQSAEREPRGGAVERTVPLTARLPGARESAGESRRSVARQIGGQHRVEGDRVAEVPGAIRQREQDADRARQGAAEGRVGAVGDRRMRIGRHDQAPVKWGLRFSAKASLPSAASSDRIS